MAKVIGIDLGTTNSAVAHINELGEAEIIDHELDGAVMPSVVAIDDKNQRIFGNAARNQAALNPTNTIYSAKRFIGHRFEDESVQDDIDRVSFKLGELDNEDTGIELDGKLRSPIEISSMIIQELKRNAEKKLGEEVEKAVITVPAYFSDAQRAATKTAGEIAGLEVLRIINEPTAAALASKKDTSGKHTIAVYDMGGGTFDITIMTIEDDFFEVLSTNGDTHLGGDDFDLRIMDRLIERFDEKERINLRDDPQAVARLRQEAEEAKKRLSAVYETEINIPFITADQTGPKHLVEPLTRAELGKMIDDLVEQSANPCKQAMEDAEVSTDDIDEVILVGGTTRMPAVQDFVEEVFGKEPNKSVNPDEVVALGAALQAGMIDENTDMIGAGGNGNEMAIVDVTPLTWGVLIQGGISDPIIPRNTKIPTKKSKIYTTVKDNQTVVNTAVLQGERAMAEDNITVAEYRTPHIRPAPAGVPQIEVTYSIDSNGILTVTAKDLDTELETKLPPIGGSGLDEERIERLKREAEEYAKADKAKLALAESRIDAESLINDAKKILQHNNDDISAILKRDILSKIDTLKKTLQDTNAHIMQIDTQAEELSLLISNANNEIYQ